MADIHYKIVLPEFNPQFVLCSKSDLGSSWDAYLGHVLSMLLGINEMPPRQIFNVKCVKKRKKSISNYYCYNRTKLVCCEIDFCQKLCEGLHKWHKCQKKWSKHANGKCFFDAHQKFTKEMIHISLNHFWLLKYSIFTH